VPGVEAVRDRRIDDPDVDAGHGTRTGSKLARIADTCAGYAKLTAGAPAHMDCVCPRVIDEFTPGELAHLLIWGHTRLAETLVANRLIDVPDLSIHPVIVGAGKLLFRDGQEVNLRLASTKSFSNIVKLTYECDYS
jgi:hypothetical protein